MNHVAEVADNIFSALLEADLKSPKPQIHIMRFSAVHSAENYLLVAQDPNLASDYALRDKQRAILHVKSYLSDMVAVPDSIIFQVESAEINTEDDEARFIISVTGDDRQFFSKLHAILEVQNEQASQTTWS